MPIYDMNTAGSSVMRNKNLYDVTTSSVVSRIKLGYDVNTAGSVVTRIYSAEEQVTALPGTATRYSDSPGVTYWSGWIYGAYFTISGFNTLTGTISLRNHINGTSSWGMTGGGQVALFNSGGSQILTTNLTATHNNGGGDYYTNTAVSWGVSGYNGSFRIAIRASSFRENTDAAATGYVQVYPVNDFWLR